MRYVNKISLPLLVLVAIVVISHWQWFFTIGLMTATDWGFYFTDTFKSGSLLPYIWDISALGGVNIQAAFYPVILGFGVLLNAGVPFAVAERILYMIPGILVSAIGMYVLGYEVFKSRWGAFSAAVVYSFNTYFIVLQAAHLSILLADAFVPLTLYSFIRLLRSPSLLTGVVCGLLLFVMSFYDFRLFYVSCFVLFLYLLFFLLESKKTVESVLQSLFYAAVPILISGLLNLYWLLGLLKVGAVTSNEVFNRSLFGSNFFNILESFALFNPFWTGGEITLFIVQPIPVAFFIVPIVALLGFLARGRNLTATFFRVDCTYRYLSNKARSGTVA
jgi:hypothetical protein